MKLGRKEILVLAVIVLILAGAVYYAFRLSEQKKFADSDAAQTLGGSKNPMNFTDLDGVSVSLDDYSKKIRVVNAWATWSPFSKDELKLLNSIAEDYNDADVVFLAINRMEPSGRVKSYLSQLEPLQNIKFIQDSQDEYFSAVEGFAMPETLVYDAEGTISLHVRGVLEEKKIRTHLDGLIQTD